MIKNDIAIIGLGITSKLAALTLASENCKVLILGQENPKPYDSNLVTFLSLNSIEFLKSIGVKTLIDESVPINEISCSKLENYQSSNKFQINFKDKKEMGRVVPNSNLSESLDNQIKINENINILNNIKIKNFKNEEANKSLLLDNGEEVFFNLLLVSDKKSHLINENFKRNIIKKDLSQTSIVMNVSTKTNNHAYQFFTKKGALAFLPINKDSASIIWSLDNNSVELEYDIKEISEVLNKIFKQITNSISVIDLQKYKLNFEYAKKITHNSIVLIGDAAHSLHPIAGQGLNLSIKDIIELKNKINHYKYLGYKLGNSISLDEYEDVRQVDNTVYTFATNYLDKVFKSRNYIVNTISNLGIANIERNNTLKNIIIKSATGQ
jgi:2-octaprenyl-6-methoxyphenol hydroxylase|tara:strand:+ start:418 stop:1560 length:1143 start_codon:yes stop_codon:yes gene_type:complete